MRKILSGAIVTGVFLALSACTDAWEERGLCSYFDACEYGLGRDLDTANYCKELGSCDDGVDHTEWRPGGGKGGGKSAGSDSGSPDAGSGDDQ